MEDDDDDDDVDDDDSEEEAEFQTAKNGNGLSRSPRKGMYGRSSVASGSSGGRNAGGGYASLGLTRGLPGFSLCQFWRYRLLLEVVLLARLSDDDVGWEGRGLRTVEEGRQGVHPGPRLVEARLVQQALVLPLMSAC